MARTTEVIRLLIAVTRIKVELGHRE